MMLLRYSKNAFKIIDFGAGIGTLSMIFRNKYKKEPLCIEIDQTNIKVSRKRNFNYLDNLEFLSNISRFNILFKCFRTYRR